MSRNKTLTDSAHGNGLDILNIHKVLVDFRLEITQMCHQLCRAE